MRHHLRASALLATALLAPLPLAQTVLYELDGTTPGAHATSVAAGEDVNADGIPDVVLSRSAFLSSSGSASLYSGAEGELILTAVGLPAPGQAFTLFGNSVALVGDLDGDGHSEFLVGDPEYDHKGRAKLHSGADGSQLKQYKGNVEPAQFGFTVAALGDVDADGFGDYAVGTLQWAHADGYVTGNGIARVYSGSSKDAIHTWAGDGQNDVFGIAMARAGDVDGDGHDDVIVGAPGIEPNPYGDSSGHVDGPGYARVFSGQTGEELYTLHGDLVLDRFGTSVACAGDVNLDGRDDVIVGAPREFGDDGYAVVYSGLDGSVLHRLIGAGGRTSFGAAVAGTGDIDLDGTPDVMVSEPLFDGAAGEDAGRVRFFSGATGLPLFSVEGDQPFEYLGRSLARVGDLTGDGRPEVALGARQASAAGGSGGAVKVVSPVSLALSASEHLLPLDAGGATLLELDLGASFGGLPYVILGTASGTSPGIPLGGAGLLPLNADGYLAFVLGHPTAAVYDAFLGTFDGDGRAEAGIAVPTGLPASLSGLTLHHAAVAFDAEGSAVTATNPVPLSLFGD